jgi:hypothetical protein
MAAIILAAEDIVVAVEVAAVGIVTDIKNAGRHLSSNIFFDLNQHQ